MHKKSCHTDFIEPPGCRVNFFPSTTKFAAREHYFIWWRFHDRRPVLGDRAHPLPIYLDALKMDGMGIGTPRTLGGIHVRVPNARFAIEIHHARTNLVQQRGEPWEMDLIRAFSWFFAVSLAMLDYSTSFSTCETNRSGRTCALPFEEVFEAKRSLWPCNESRTQASER